MEFYVIVLLGIFSVPLAKAIFRLFRKKRLYSEARTFMSGVRQRRALPVVQTNLLLKANEVAFYSAPSALYETRAVRQYRSRHTGIRLAKGFYIGRTKGRSISTQQWTKIDTGKLTVTNLRVIFEGRSENRSISVNKIVSVESGLNQIEVATESRQKSMMFAASNPLILAAIIRICSQVEDARNLSHTTLNVEYV